MGRLTPEEALVHPRRHQLTRAIGVDDDIEIDVMSLSVQAGDRIVLCSDGLSNELDPTRLADLASAPGSLEDVVRSLVDAAKVAGGRDNITAVILEFDEAHEATRVINTTMSPAPPPVVPTQPSRRRRREPRFTWRSVAGLVLLGGVVWAFLFIIHWYAYSTYYLASDGKYIGVYEGQPSGVFWYKPRLVTNTSFLVKHLEPSSQVQLSKTISEPSVNDALNYAHFLYNLWAANQKSGGATTTATTTTVASTTTTRASAG